MNRMFVKSWALACTVMVALLGGAFLSKIQAQEALPYHASFESEDGFALVECHS